MRILFNKDVIATTMKPINQFDVRLFQSKFDINQLRLVIIFNGRKSVLFTSSIGKSLDRIKNNADFIEIDKWFVVRYSPVI